MGSACFSVSKRQEGSRWYFFVLDGPEGIEVVKIEDQEILYKQWRPCSDTHPTNIRPNLNLLDSENRSLWRIDSEDYVSRAESVATEYGFELTHRQYNDEGSIVEEIQSAEHIKGSSLTQVRSPILGWFIHDVSSLRRPIVELTFQPMLVTVAPHFSCSTSGDRVNYGFRGYGYELAVHALATPEMKSLSAEHSFSPLDLLPPDKVALCF